MRGWEHVTPTDVARLGAKLTPAKAALGSRRHKFHAEPCIVTVDGTLFTTAEIFNAELAFATDRVGVGTGTLIERAARIDIRGQWFASTKEGRRYLELLRLQTVGAITHLRTQVPYDLTVVSKVDGRDQVIGKWIADFVYRRAGELITEDTKGVKTPLYKRSRRHFEAQYGLRILET